MKTFDLVSMGRCLLDLYANEMGAAFVDVKSFSAYVGGCPTNIAVGARRLGLNVALVSAVGQDLAGDFILNYLAREGVETRFIPRKPGTRTSAVLVSIEPPDKFPIVYYRENAPDHQLTIDDVSAAPLAGSAALLVAGGNLLQDPLRTATLFAAETARSAGTTIFFDLDLRADLWRDLREYGTGARSLLPLVDIAIGTEEEVRAAFLSNELDSAIRACFALGTRALVVKRGPRGSSVFTREGAGVDVPGFAVKVYNTLGAGDAFASGFIYGYTKGWDWYRCARMGNANGALVVTRHGCSNFMGYEQEVLDFINSRGGF